jgi:alkanesulfonate monooxygenase SsuD/methylene tetrahydromethanopterin reductase-like flavin-dependent oxidoreductase (luciferase family)
MEFGILFTSHPNTEAEPYPHRDVHARVTQQILRADELGYDYAWVAEHHFSNEYGIMPDVFVYAAYLAALTKRIKIGTAVVTLPLANPLRVAENAAFVDILSNGRFALGLGSGYRKYEFDGFGVDFDKRRDIQEEALPLLLDLFHAKRVDHHDNYFNFKIAGPYELFPHAVQVPHPPIFLAGATDRSIGVAARMGLGLFLSSWTPFAELARQSAGYRAALTETPQKLRANPARGHVDIARWVYVAETDAVAKRESEPGIMRSLQHFSSGHTSGYLGTVSQDVGATPRDYDALARDIILHGSAATVTAKIEELQATAGNASIMLHFPPWYGAEKALASLERFAGEVMPKFREKPRAQKRA